MSGSLYEGQADGEHSLPLVCELTPPPDPAAAFARLADRRQVLFLDSAQRHPQLGRYSFLAAEPFAVVQAPVGTADALAMLEQAMAPFAEAARSDLPPFQGGAAGVLGYELAHSLEKVPAAKCDEFQFPALWFGLYDVVLAFDHVAQRAWIISQGFPATEPAARRERAAARLKEFQEWLQRPPAVVGTLRVPSMSREDSDGTRSVPATCFPIVAVPGLVSNFTRDAYCAAVERGIDYIRAGDIFQVNLSQRLLYPAVAAPPQLYERLRERNPATFMAYLDLGERQIVSASPERFVQVRNRRVETRPIKGTRPRTRQAEADLFLGDDLLASAKDRAENVMIVDLLRNDMSRVCTADSVHVTQLCGLETYQFVQHLVSAVEGELAAGKSAIDLIRASFPGGSITGAPKVRAMEIIAELEPTARGAYCGSLGYWGFDGSLDTSILIRTITCSHGWWQLPVGGGVVAASDPVSEYEETWHKAAGMVRALQP